MAQTQTPNKYSKQGNRREISPATDVYPGDIYVAGNVAYLATDQIAGTTTSFTDGTPPSGGVLTEGVWHINKDASVFADGDDVFWLPVGSPNVGTASTGAASLTAAGAIYLGTAVGASLTGDQYVHVLVKQSHFSKDTVNIVSLGTNQSSAPTAAQLLADILTQTGATGAGTVTFPSGTAISAAYPTVPAIGTRHKIKFCNLGGGQTLTLTGATGSTMVGAVAVASAKNADLELVNTATNAWNVYTNVSA